MQCQKDFSESLNRRAVTLLYLIKRAELLIFRVEEFILAVSSYVPGATATCVRLKSETTVEERWSKSLV